MLRKPKIDVPNAVPDNHLIWHSLTCELITPMYGGGTVSTKVDEKMPIRASSIRGALRFWWRLLAKNHANKEVWNVKNIKQAESELWGGGGNGDDDGKASKVLLKITKQPKVTDQNLAPYTDYIATQKEVKDGKKRLEYVLFPASNAKDKVDNPHKLLEPNNMGFQLDIAFVNTNDDQKKQVIETLQWWANFGGLGFRSRKGLGAIAVTECTDFPEICQSLTTDDVKQAGCLLQIRQQNHPTGLRALEAGIQKYADFRQKAGVGRKNPAENSDKPAGRSYWSEPDAIRRITDTYLDLTEENAPNRPIPTVIKDHKPIHKAGNVFPRAVFGLPILYKFMNDEYYDKKDPKDKNEKRKRITEPDRPEPALTEVSFGIGDGRLASPLIIRPRKLSNGRFEIVALALPYQDILNQNVVINGNEYPIWQNNTAEHITPIRENGGGDPIQAFLTYFVRP